MNLKQMLDKTVRQYGEKTAIILGDHRLSYAQLDEASNKVANTLIKMGVSKGDRVVMLLPNSLEFVTTYFGVVKIGAVAVPLDIRFRIAELTSLFDNSQPKVLVSESPTLEPIVPALPTFKSIEHVIDISGNYEGQFLSYQQIMATGSPQRIEADPEPEDTATISYTGGPINHPRGVMLSHHCLITEVAIAGNGFQQTDKDIVMLFALPMYHMFGLTAVLLTVIYKGSTVVMVPGISISNLLEVIERKKGTMFIGVPFIYHLLINMAEAEGVKHNLSSLRLCGSGGATLPIDTIQRFKQHYGLDIIDFWGLSEAVCHVTCQPIDGTGKLGSVGKTLPGWEVKIVDDNGNEMPTNEPGEMIVRGPIMKGYYNNPQATAEAIKDGWLYTGDIGRVDEDGYLFILASRKKEIIIIKGQNVYPSDIEAVLYTHPKVAEAAVIGVSDEIRGETVRAIISLKRDEVATEPEIKRFCREYMADYKVPRQIIFMDSLPKTANGKIRKEDLKDYLPT